MTETAELEAALQTQISGLTNSPVKINNLYCLAGGASQESWCLELVVEKGEWQGKYPLILRRPLGGQIFSIANDLRQEYEVLHATYASGVPSPRPFWLLENLLGGPATLVQRLGGDSIGRKLVRDPKMARAREQLPAQIGAALATLHKVDYQKFGLDQLLTGPESGLTPAQTRLRLIRTGLDTLGEPHPVLELAMRWLHKHEPPPPERLVLIHGDFRIGNVLVDEAGLVAVIDWEFSHIGDFAEDLAYPLVKEWRFGMDNLRLGGIGQPGAFFAAYEETSGHPLDLGRVFYWELLGNVWWALGLLNQTKRHLSGEQPNLEFACLGRRCCELELEILGLLKLAQTGLDNASSKLYRKPNAVH